MTDCTACQHPVIIPDELREVVTEIHTCQNESKESE